MEKQHVLDTIEKLKSKYSDKADKTLEKAVKSVDAQSVSALAIVASRYEAKVDALEELLERLQEEE
jgi:hypothetical protein